MILTKHLKKLFNYAKGKKSVPPPKIIFFHIPKCGGSSLAHALSDCFPANTCFNVKPMKTRKFGTIIWEDFEPQEGRNKEAFYQYYTFKFREYILLYALSCGYDFVTGHLLFSNHAYRNFKQDGYQFITMVRDPVKRFISQYKFSAIDQYTLDEYVELDTVTQQGNMLVRYFSGNPDKDEWAGSTQLEQALENIKKFDMIADLEHVDRFQDQFQKTFTLKLAIPHLNQNTRPSIQITPEQKAKIVTVCEPDITLYQEIVKRI